jgi:hypothetical protein
VGKIDPQTGREIFKPDFIPNLARYGKPLPAQYNGTFSIRDLRTSTIRDYGATYFLDCIAQRIGLKEVLSSSCRHLSREILTLAGYLICSEDPFAYCVHWYRGNGNGGRPVVILPARVGSASRNKRRLSYRFLQTMVGIPAEALECYRAKNVVEKGFLKLKNAIDLRRIRVHSQESIQTKYLSAS